MELDQNINTLTKEEETRLITFFNKSLDAKSMAKKIRKLNYILALSVMRECETMQTEKVDVEDGFYWLNELAEVLNPYLDTE